MKSLNANISTMLKVEALQIDEGVVSKIKGLGHAPLRDFGPDDIYARRCWLTGDKLNSRFGQFRTKDLPHVGALCIDAPVLVGHDMSMIPIGRFFDSKVEQHSGGTFIVPSFYWPRSTGVGESLVAAIDYGLAGEASIRFTFETPTCGLCGKDMRSFRDCQHYPGEKDEKTGDVAFYYYDGVNYVYEGSLVARGAHPDTKFGLLGVLSDSSDDVYAQLMDKPKTTVRRVLDMGGNVLDREVRRV